MREVYAHLSNTEKAQLQCQGGLYGVWCGLTFAIPLSNAIVFRNPTVIAIAAILITIHVACLPIWRRRLKRIMCASTWAQQHGFTPEQI
jgi:hypothetical protein